MDALLPADELKTKHVRRREDEEAQKELDAKKNAKTALANQKCMITNIINELADDDYGSTIVAVSSSEPSTMPVGMIHTDIVEYLKSQRYACTVVKKQSFDTCFQKFTANMPGFEIWKYKHAFITADAEYVCITWDLDLLVGFVPTSMYKS